MKEKEFKSLIKKLETIKKLLIASLYVYGIPSEDLSKISGMNASSIKNKEWEKCQKNLRQQKNTYKQ